MKIALLFPGQGSQYVGMGKYLYDNYPEAKEVFDEASEALHYDMKKLCFSESIEELTKTQNAQPAIVTVSVAAFKVYMKEFGVEPLMTAGHSLGEFSALTCAGVIKFKDCLRIVSERGRLMQQCAAAGKCTMYAITGVSSDIVEEEYARQEAYDKGVYISNYNSPGQIVISGYESAVEKFCNSFEKIGAKLTQLKVSAAFHTPLMQKAARGLSEELSRYEYDNFKWPVVANASAVPYGDSSEIIGALTTQLVSPVRWKKSMEYINSHGVAMAIELGPKNVLKNLMRSNASDIKAFTYDALDDVEAIRQELFVNNIVTMCVAEAVSTRNNNWDNEEYEKGVIKPYKELRSLQNSIESEKRMPTTDEMREAVDKLLKIFETKKLPKSDQFCRLKAIFEATATESLFKSVL